MKAVVRMLAFLPAMALGLIALLIYLVALALELLPVAPQHSDPPAPSHHTRITYDAPSSTNRLGP